MAIAAKVDLRADRWTPFARTIRFEGFDLTEADLRMQVRLYANQRGLPLIDLTMQSTLSAEGIKLVMVEQENGVSVSTIALRINESTMEGLPFSGELGTDSRLAWDMHVTPAGALKERWLFGDFVVVAGVTQ